MPALPPTHPHVLLTGLFRLGVHVRVAELCATGGPEALQLLRANLTNALSAINELLPSGGDPPDDPRDPPSL